MAVRLRTIIVVFAIAATIGVITTLATYWFGERVLQSHAREEIRREVIRQLEQLLSTVKDAEAGQRGFIITGDDRYLEPYYAAEKHLWNDLESFKSKPRLDITAEDVANVERLIRSKMDEMRSSIEARRADGFESGLRAVENDKGREIMNALRAEIARIQAKKTGALEAEV